MDRATADAPQDPRQHSLGLSGGMTQAVELPGRKCRERDNHRRLIGPNGFSPDQALGREGKDPAGDRRIGMVAFDRFPALRARLH